MFLLKLPPAEPAHNAEETGQEALVIAAAALNTTEHDTEGDHLIAETSFAAISGDDAAAVPKLVIAIDGAKSTGPLNVVPGCYIEPNHKTLWRIGVALNKLNGHSVYQNMYAVFAVNPKSFPSGGCESYAQSTTTLPDYSRSYQPYAQGVTAIIEADAVAK